jgi:membrane-bound metal-dependent hydrolase YbcI (DUF457 family)
MMAPTHAAFAVALGMLGGANPLTLKLLAAGSLLPDIDHPQSAMGRVFFFFSVPLNKYFGHRRTIHGIALWAALSAVGLVWEPALWLAIGAISHVFLDCLNVSGVQALMPFSERVCVLFDHKWRMVAGSRGELFLLCALGLVAWSGGYIGSTGGLRAMIGNLTGSYKIAYQQYEREGLTKCALEGKIRYQAGIIEEGRWLIVGREGGQGLAIWDDKRRRIMHIPKEGVFLRARLRKEGRAWDSARIEGWAETQGPVYYYDGKQWRFADTGDVVLGWVIGERLSLTGVRPFAGPSG